MSTPAAMMLSVRRMANDWGIGTIISNEAIDASETEIDVVSVPANLKAGMYIEWDLEMMEHVSGTATPITVLRGRLGTTAATHTTALLGVIEPRFSNTSILECLNEAVRVLNRQHPRDVYLTDTTLVTASATESFSMPAEPAGTGEYLDILGVEIETETSGLYRPTWNWKQEGHNPPTLRLYGTDAVGRDLRLHLTQQFPTMAYTDASTPTGLTDERERFLVKYAAGLLLEYADIYAADMRRQDVQVAADLRGRQQVIGRNLQAGALDFLTQTLGSVRQVTMTSAQNYRR